MNIFCVDEDPITAAKALCNKHIVKMIVESAQLLCNAHIPGAAPYKHTHVHHPCSLWTSASIQNYEWLCLHALTLCEEYTKRYEKQHKTEDVVIWCAENVPVWIPNIGLTPFARAIKEPYKTQSRDMDIISAYRHYYIHDKMRFATWSPRAVAPSWWPVAGA
jgi:hypothetical protein